MSIKADTHHTYKFPGSCPGCYEDDAQYIETEHYGDGDHTEVRRSCDVCGCRWEEIMSIKPDRVEISRPPQERSLDQLWDGADIEFERDENLVAEFLDPKSPAGQYLLKKAGGRKASSGTPRTAGLELEAAWFGSRTPKRTAGGLSDLEDFLGKDNFRALVLLRRNLMGATEVSTQTAELLGDCMLAMNKKLKLDSNTKTALNKMRNLDDRMGAEGARNQIFKIADLLGMKLPSAMFASTGARTAGRVLKRQEKILQKYLDSGGDELWWDSLPPRVQQDLRRVKDTETLHHDVSRWLMDNNSPQFTSGIGMKWGGE
jgi:hypothetical protein